MTRLALVAVTAAMMTAATAVSPTATAAPAAGQPASSAARTVLLITGERFVATPGPAGPMLDRLPGGPKLGLLSVGFAGTRYEIPDDALPYLGRGLDPALFGVSSLLGQETDGRIPVVVRYPGRLPALPGIRITGTAAGTATGYLTASSARTFGTALDRQFIADHARASYGTDGIFGSGISISLSGSGIAAARMPGRPGLAARPSFGLRTLTVRGADLSGRPDTGDIVVLMNVDNPVQFSDLGFAGAFFDRGVAKFSVPRGHYFAMAFFTQIRRGSQVASRITVLPQFTVSGDVTVRAGERAANSAVTMVTPRRTVLADSLVVLLRTPAAGPKVAFNLDAGGLPEWISPTRKRPTVGNLATVTSALLTAPERSGRLSQPGYSYLLSYQDLSGLIHRQLFRATPSNLAAISSRFYSSKPLPQGLGVAGTYPVENDSVLGFGLIAGAGAGLTPGADGRAPLLYLTANPSLTWFFTLARSQADGEGTAYYYQQLETRSYRAGRFSQAWNQYPLHPAPTVDLPGPAAQGPLAASASRAANDVTIFLWPFTDNQPGHEGVPNVFLFEPGVKFTGRYEFDQNGVRIASGASGAFFWRARLSPKPSVIRFALDETRSGAPYRLSVRTHTVWTWRSAPDPAATLPKAWICGSSLADDFTTRCASQDLLSLDYNVAGMRADGSVPAGRQSLTVTVSHFQPIASPANISRVRVRVSFDNGRSWRRASVSARGHGRFAASYLAPRTARYAELRVTAADAAGSTVTETLPRAYRVSARSAARPALRAACPAARPGFARCFVLYAPHRPANLATGPHITPPGWGARELEAAYKLPAGRTSRPTVAVSIAFDTPRLERYLAIYRRQFGLPPCTTANGCFRKVNQRGFATRLPPSGVGTGWDLEATLDVSMISAACPSCRILVVEASDSSLANLAASENTAARLGAQVISNSYGASESAFSQKLAAGYDHPGHTIVASSGDFGFTAAQFPANLTTVTAVGGTELSRARNARGWRELVWITPFSGASGSGCSAFVAKPAWQHDTACGMRTSADVSAVADHVAIYNADYGGWQTVAGTSASAPLIAGIYGLAGNAGSITPGYAYRHAKSLFDVTAGNNDVLNGTGGASCDFDYLCVARTGYDAPTGLGTPDGIGAF